MMKGKKVTVNKRLSLQIKKTCGCGITHSFLPTGSVQTEAFYWFNCACHSTLVIKI